MIPGFVVLGAIAATVQVAVIAGGARYVQSRHPLEAPGTRRRLRRWLVSGTVLAVAGQLLALGAVGYVWIDPEFPFETMSTLVDVGVLGLVAGYSVIFATFVLYTRAAP